MNGARSASELIAILVDRRRRLDLTQADVGNTIDAAASEVGGLGDWSQDAPSRNAYSMGRGPGREGSNCFYRWMQ